MTATTADIDLSWVTFSDNSPGETCEHTEPCPAEAVYRATFKPAPRLGLPLGTCNQCCQRLFCLQHAHDTTYCAKQAGGLFICDHDLIIRLVAMEPLR